MLAREAARADPAADLHGVCSGEEGDDDARLAHRVWRPAPPPRPARRALKILLSEADGQPYDL
eukprot:COSAG01_NODE_36583_length_515_cov_2.911058_1_plen_62_part_10